MSGASILTCPPGQARFQGGLRCAASAIRSATEPPANARQPHYQAASDMMKPKILKTIARHLPPNFCDFFKDHVTAASANVPGGTSAYVATSEGCSSQAAWHQGGTSSSAAAVVLAHIQVGTHADVRGRTRTELTQFQGGAAADLSESSYDNCGAKALQTVQKSLSNKRRRLNATPFALMYQGEPRMQINTACSLSGTNKK